MKQQIEELRKIGQSLEPSFQQRAAVREQIIAHAEDFITALPRRPAFRFTEREGRGILESPISETPVEAAEALSLLKEHVEAPGVKLGSPGYLAFIPISSLHTAALGDYLAAVINPYAGAFFTSPGAVRLERVLTRWMAGFVGYDDRAAGDLTSGGSMSNLIAIVTAREAHELKGRNYEKAAVYLTSQTHHSVTKALRLAGLGECPRRLIPLDANYRMRTDALDQAIRDDRRAGLHPWLVVAAAGTTDTGAVDPLAAMAAIAREHGLWMHVDGAYGAVFALSASGRAVLAGMELSDSLILDPHKGLFMPCGSGAVLVKSGAALRHAHGGDAHYMQDRKTLASSDETSPSDLSPELTRPFRGLRLWLSLKLHGVGAFRAALEEKLLLARYFHKEIQKLDGFAVGPPPDLSIVTFRCLPRRGDANEFNRRLLDAVHRDGRIFITSTNIDGNLVLRLAVLCVATHLETVDLALEILRDKAAELGA